MVVVFKFKNIKHPNYTFTDRKSEQLWVFDSVFETYLPHEKDFDKCDSFNGGSKYRLVSFNLNTLKKMVKDKGSDHIDHREDRHIKDADSTTISKYSQLVSESEIYFREKRLKKLLTV